MPKRILQIDDEPAISAALSIRLRAAGFSVITASDGPTGLALARAESPEAILLDIRMPEMDGFEVCRRLKADPELRDIPVVFLSANANPDTWARAEQLGAAALMAKPYEAAEVVDVILASIAEATETASPPE